jgi:hypothetical protein
MSIYCLNAEFFHCLICVNCHPIHYDPIGPLPVAAAAAASERASAADRAIAAHLAAVGNATLTLSVSPSASQSGNDDQATANEASASSSSSSLSEPTPAALWTEMQRLIAALADSHRRHSVAAADDTRHTAAQVWRCSEEI